MEVPQLNRNISVILLLPILVEYFSFRCGPKRPVRCSLSRPLCQSLCYEDAGVPQLLRWYRVYPLALPFVKCLPFGGWRPKRRSIVASQVIVGYTPPA